MDPVTAALAEVLAAESGTPATSDLRNEVHEFYRLREGTPAWVSGAQKARAAEAVQVLRSARDHGLAPDDYSATTIAQQRDAAEQLDSSSPDHARQLAELDTRLTSALIALGHDVALGRTTPDQPGWEARREAPDLAGTLHGAASEDVRTWLAALQPRHPEYQALRGALMDLYGQQEQGGWVQVPDGTFRLGRSHASVVLLRQRLAAGGYLSGAAATSASPVYSEEVDKAVRGFQTHHAIAASGVVDAATRTAMNVSIDERIHQVTVNMERWRWMPDDLGARHLLVNIPYYHLMERENGKVIEDIRVVVGTRENQTPIFSGLMETVVFSPYWNIPDSIAEGETAPAMARDPRYLARNNIEILRRSGTGEPTQVDPSSVDWDDPRELEQLAFRQRPGPNNALGHVKFLFPNEHNVYLHDTPADELFARPGRAFSHGCIRVEEPEALASYVLRDDPAWTDALILDAMNAGVEKHVKLKAPIPVHIVYFTAWVDDSGGLHFQPDVYGYDRRP